MFVVQQPQASHTVGKLKNVVVKRIELWAGFHVHLINSVKQLRNASTYRRAVVDVWFFDSNMLGDTNNIFIVVDCDNAKHIWALRCGF